MTAELALCLPAVLLVLLLVVTLGAASVAQLRCTDAARAGARAAALGHSQAEVHRIVADRAGDGAAVRIDAGPEWVRVQVSRPLVSQWWGTWRISAEFSAVPEPSAEP
ncbi:MULTISPECIES: TadE family type IV pilus minor pilin [unclassified Pseudactinotalea]|uniref:TadE family type IV pilus minor pilin n=1 Tax=Micrococcales TaxID=85006 RepID=UPI003C7A0DE1